MERQARDKSQRRSKKQGAVTGYIIDGTYGKTQQDLEIGEIALEENIGGCRRKNKHYKNPEPGAPLITVMQENENKEYSGQYGMGSNNSLGHPRRGNKERGRRRSIHYKHHHNQEENILNSEEASEHQTDISEKKNESKGLPKRRQKQILSNHNQVDLEEPIKILEMENRSLQEQNTALKESMEKMQGELENFSQQHATFWETIENFEKEKEYLQKRNKSLQEYVSILHQTINTMEQFKKCQESKLSLEEAIEMILEANDDAQKVNETRHIVEAFEGTIRNLERENRGLKDYSTALVENIKEIADTNEEFNNYINKSEEIIEGLKISESAHEDTVKALLKASEDQQEKEQSLTLRIEELREEQARQEELIANTEKTIKMLMEENDEFQNTEAALQETVRQCEEDSERYRDSQLCIICINEEVQQVFLPCHHLITCSDCSKSLLNCPLCRQKIDEKFQVYKQ